jgi:NitT/TauT family transport system substrate-binding protein
MRWTRAAALAALAAAPVAVRAQTALVPLRVVGSPVDDVMPVLYAARAGMFKSAGLDVTIDKIGNGAALAAAVAGGADDIGKANVATVVTAHAHGIPMVLIAPAAIYDPRTPDAVLATRADSPIASARDLAGKTIAVPSINDLSTVSVKAWMVAAGVDWSGTQFLETPFSAMGGALEAGRVQAAVLIKPFISDAVDAGKAKVLGLCYSAIATRFLESAWFANADFVAAHRPAVAAFQRVVAQASAYTNAHQSETAELLANWTGIDPQRAARIPRIITGTTLDPRDIQPVIDMSAKYGLIAKGFDAREIIAK